MVWPSRTRMMGPGTVPSKVQALYATPGPMLMRVSCATSFTSTELPWGAVGAEASYVLWAGTVMAGCELLPVVAPELLEEPLLDEPFPAFLAPAPGMPVTEKMNARISAKPVKVAKTISAGEPRQNRLEACGCVAGDVK